MAAAPKQTPSSDKDEGEHVTYWPGHGDPHTVKWRGIEFKAGQPKKLRHAEHIEAARGNRYFHVGDGDAPEVNPNLGPTDANGYRAHVVRWLDDMVTVEELIAKWAGEREMRDRCGTGDDDIRFLGPLVEPKLREMRRKEGLNDRQVADVWMKYGIFDLPWRG